MKSLRMISAGAFLASLSVTGLATSAIAQAGRGAAVVPAVSAIVAPGFYVADVERSLKFYRDMLGMTVRMKYGPLDRPDVVIGFGSDPTQVGVMLLSDRAGRTPRNIQHGHGYDRLAVRLADLSATHAQLRAAGYAVSDIRVVHDMFLMAMTTDPDGYKVELLGPRQQQ